MRLLFPSLFWAWIPLLLVPLLLYLFRPRPRTVPTSTLPFFQRLARHYQDSAWLRWLKHLVSLLLSLLVMTAGAAALGRLVMAPPDDAMRTVVVLVDRSASMASQTDGGPTRLEEAIAWAGRRLSTLPAGVGVIVVGYDSRPEVLLSRSTDPRQVTRALASLVTRPIAGDAETALRLARRLAALETPAAVWHFTTRPAMPTHSEERQEEVAVEHLDVALPDPVNVGITAFSLCRLPLEQGRFEAFVEVHSAAGRPTQAELEVSSNDKLVAIRKLSIAARGKQSLLIPLEADPQQDRIVTLRVTSPGDMLAADNVILARVPRMHPLRVLWISPSPDPFTELALSSLGAAGELRIAHGSPKAWPSSKPPDVVIFDGWLPSQWPTCPAVVVVNPPGSLGPVRAVPLSGAGLPLDSLRAADRGHPLLYGVATGRVALMQTAVVEAAGALEAVWTGPQGPVLVAGENRSQRVVVMAFSPQRSEQLPLLASYPMLVGNAIYWTAQSQLEMVQGAIRRTGQLVPVAGTSLAWQEPDRLGTLLPDPREGSWIELDRVGLWETGKGDRGSAALLSSRETLLTAVDRDEPQAEAAAGTWWRGDLAPWLMWGIFAVLLSESWLFHRLWIA